MRGRGPARSNWVSRLEGRFADPCSERGKTARWPSAPRGSSCVPLGVWLARGRRYSPGRSFFRRPRAGAEPSEYLFRTWSTRSNLVPPMAGDLSAGGCADGLRSAWRWLSLPPSSLSWGKLRGWQRPAGRNRQGGRSDAARSRRARVDPRHCDRVGHARRSNRDRIDRLRKRRPRSRDVGVRGHTTGRLARVQVIADGTTSYTRSDQLSSLPEGRKWVKIDFSSTDSSSSLLADGGPKEGLKLLEQLDGAEEIGKEDIRGVASTRYRGTLSVSAREVFGVEVQVSPPHVEVWIDAWGRVRRMTVIISGSVVGEKGSTTTDVTMDFFDFGPVSKIDLPKQDEIYDATGRVESKFRSSAEAP
jgi:hypothetical protein